jgi:hypothetical protein
VFEKHLVSGIRLLGLFTLTACAAKERLDIADNAVSQSNPDCTIDSTWDPTIGQPSATALEQLASLGRLCVGVFKQCLGAAG